MNRAPDKKDAKEIFSAAIEYYMPHQWEAYLVDACGDDEALRQRVRELLEAHRQGDSFLDGADKATEGQPVTERPGSQIGPYKLLQEIGEGGFGVVYMAEQQEPVRRKVALKIIKPGMDTKQVIARFEAERQALAMMDHPNIAKVLGAGATESGRPFFVMELVKGVPVTEFCDSNKLSTQQRLDLFVTVCHAVQHAHQKGVIHRDIKPSNVMVTLHDNKPMPVIIDFGVSKAISHQLTEKTLFTAYGQMVGTPAYMSPEQAQMSRMDIDTRSDVYSLGVLLYELLTGSTPLDAQQLRGTAYAEMQRMIREEEAPKPSTRVSTLGKALSKIAQDRGTDPKRLGQFLRGDLDWIVMKSLEKERSRRYETANGLANDIERFLNDEAVEACPPSLAYQVRKFVGRNRGLVTTASMVMAAVLLGIVGTTLGMLRARHDAGVARTALTEADRLRVEKEREAELAMRAKLEADRLRDEAKSQSAEHLMMRASAERDRGDVTLAALLGAEALRQDSGNPERELNHRLRLAADLRQCPRPTEVLCHDSRVLDARFSGDGQWIATGCEDGTVRVFDAQTGEIERVLEHDGSVSQLTFLLNDTRLLTNETVADAENVDEAIRVHLWDWRSGQSIAINSSRNSTWHPSRFQNRSFPIAAGPHEFRVLSAQDGQPIGPPLTSERSINTCHYFGDAGLVVGLSPPQESVTAERSPVDNFRDSFLSRVGLGAPTTLEIWSADSGERVTLLEVEPSRERFSSGRISEGGSRFAMGYRGHIHIFDTRSGELLQRVELETVATRPNAFGTSFRSAVAGTPREFSPDGGTLFCSQGSEIVLIDVESGTVRSRIRPVIRPAIRSRNQPAIGQRSPMELTKFSPDSSLILAVNGQGHPQLWDATSGHVASGPLEVDSTVADCEFSADGRYLKVETASGAVRIWDLETQQPAAPVMRHSGTIQKSSFSRDGSHLLVAAGEKVYLWPVGWPEFQQVTISTAAAGLPNEAANRGLFARSSLAHISPDGTRLITAFRDARVWDTTTGRQLLEPFRLSNDPLFWTVNFDASGRFVLFTGVGIRGRSPVRNPGSNREATLFLWDTETGRQFELSVEGQLGNTGVSDDGSVVWATARRTSGTRDDFRAAMESGILASNIRMHRFTYFWDSETGEPLGEPIAEVLAVRRGFAGMASRVSRDAAWMVTQDADAFHIVDTRTGEQIKDSIPHEEDGVRQAMLSHDNRRLISVCKSDDRLSVREWDLERDGGCLNHREIKLSRPFPNPSVQVSPTNKQLVVHSVAILRRGPATPSRSRDSEASTAVLLCDFATDQTIQLHHEFAVQHVAFSPDGSTVLTSSLERVIRVWDSTTGELVRALEDAGESAKFTAARFSDDGRRVVAVKGNSGLCIWDVATGQSLAPPLRTQDEGGFARFGRGARGGQSASNMVSRAADRFVVRRDGQFIIYDLSADTRSVEDLTQLTRLLSGRRVNQLGNVETLTPEDWKQEWAACGDLLYERMEKPPRGEDWHRLHVESSDPAVVLWHHEQLIAADPNDGERHKKRARTLIRLDRHEEAVADLDAARALGVTVDEPRGRSLLILGRWAEAAVDLESAALDRPMSTILPIDFYGAAVAHLLAGDRRGYERVCELFLEKALKFSDSQAPIHAIRVALLAPRDEAYCENLQQQWEDIVTRTRSRQSSIVLIDQLFAFRRGDYPAVLADRDENTNGQPNVSVNQLFLRAMAHHKLGDEEKSKELLAEATELLNEIPNTIQLYDSTRQLDNGTRDLVILPLPTTMVLQREAIDLISEDELPNE